MIALCTLYDSNYLNRGLALYESIERYTHDYVMYVLAMDDTCFDILQKMNLPRMTTLRLSDFETEGLRAVKKGRPYGQYCYTCKAPLLKYTLQTTNQQYCAYLDSDLYFYGDPNLFASELEQRQASVLLVGHRYNRSSASYNEWRIGKFCAGTVVIKNTPDGLYMLNGWEAQCLESCESLNDGIHCGDQKYLDLWAKNCSFVVETTNMGAGIASWNLAQYRLKAHDSYGPTLVTRKGKECKPLFYHYHALTYTAQRRVRAYAMTAWGASKSLLDIFYKPYLRHLESINNRLKAAYGLNVVGNKMENTDKSANADKWRLRLKKMALLFSLSGLSYLFLQDLPTKYYWELDEVDF